MLVLAVEADDGRLAVALGGPAQRLDRLLAEQRPELLAHLDERGQVLLVPAGERVLDPRDRRRLADRARGLPLAVGPDLLHDGDELADLHAGPYFGLGHGSSFTGSGPTRQTSSAYWRIVRSLAKRPAPATFLMDMRSQSSGR